MTKPNSQSYIAFGKTTQSYLKENFEEPNDNQGAIQKTDLQARVTGEKLVDAFVIQKDDAQFPQFKEKFLNVFKPLSSQWGPKPEHAYMISLVENLEQPNIFHCRFALGPTNSVFFENLLGDLIKKDGTYEGTTLNKFVITFDPETLNSEQKSRLIRFYDEFVTQKANGQTDPLKIIPFYGTEIANLLALCLSLKAEAKSAGPKKAENIGNILSTGVFVNTRTNQFYCVESGHYYEINPEDGTLTELKDAPRYSGSAGSIMLGKYEATGEDVFGIDSPTYKSIKQLKSLKLPFVLPQPTEIIEYKNIFELGDLTTRVFGNTQTGELAIMLPKSDRAYKIDPQTGTLTKMNDSQWASFSEDKNWRNAAGAVIKGQYQASKEQVAYGYHSLLTKNIQALRAISITSNPTGLDAKTEEEIFKRASQIIGETLMKELGSPQNYKTLYEAILKATGSFDITDTEALIKKAEFIAENFFVYSAKDKLHVNRSNNHYYVDTDETEGIQQIQKILDERPAVEECWVYAEFEMGGKQYKRWFECGTDETANNVGGNYYIVPRLMRQGAVFSKLAFYHYHDFNTERVQAVPSDTDINGYQKSVSNLAGNYGLDIPLEYNVVTKTGTIRLTSKELSPAKAGDIVKIIYDLVLASAGLHEPKNIIGLQKVFISEVKKLGIEASFIPNP